MKCFTQFCLIFLLSTAAFAHPEGHLSIQETVDDIRARMAAELSANQVADLNQDTLWELLNEEERHVLSTEYWSFRVDVPATVLVAFNTRQPYLPRWLEEEGFARTNLHINVQENEYVLFAKDQPAGHVGLGYNDLGAFKYPYFVMLAPQQGPATITVSQMHPGRHTATELKPGALVYGDNLELKVTALPDILNGLLLLRGRKDRAGDTHVLNTPQPPQEKETP